jgi:putative nucleotidyltransferase with HDIG domain
VSASGFLISLGQCLATMNLYAEGHPARERALDNSYERLRRLLEGQERFEVSFVNTETVVGDRALSDIGIWDWAPRLAGIGVERIEIEPGVTSDEYDRFVDDIWRKLNGRPDSSAEARQMASSSIRFGPLLVRDGGDGSSGANGAGFAMLAGVASSLSLQDEAATVDWIHDEVSMSERLPMGEVEAVVRSLSVAMQMEHRMLLPLLDLKRFDQYTTTHACNVSVLAMGLAEQLGLGRDEVRSFGVAGLLHDLGKIRIPKEILTKPGKLSEEERTVIQQHPVEGARMVLSRERGLGVAAVVAYEHHVCIDGGGYPTFRFTRNCHYASRIVHVCDIYDALCTNRPYRDAWEPEKALSYLESRAGSEVDAEITRVFCALVRGSVPARLPMPEETPTA